MLHPVFLKSLKFSLLAGASLLAGGAILQACAPLQAEMREVTAERIARPAFMVERRLSAGPMDFQLWERMHAPGAPANVYIEGDGKISAKGGIDRKSVV